MKRKLDKPFYTFGIAMRRIRKGWGFTQKVMAGKLGCDSQFISNAERGMCLLPEKQMKVLVKLIRQFQSRDQDLCNLIRIAMIKDAEAHAIAKCLQWDIA